MYLKFLFILCDITVILATNHDNYRYDVSLLEKDSTETDIRFLQYVRDKRAVAVETATTTSTSYNVSNSKSNLSHSSSPVDVVNMKDPKDSPVGTKLNTHTNYSTIASPHTEQTSPLSDETFNFNEPLSFNITNETLKHNNISKTVEDNFLYYNSTRTEDEATGRHYWIDMANRENVTTHQMLSQSHRRANTVPLPFKFQFYGHEIDNVTIATGGFLYTGYYIHSWLAATQYIAPLMANFDTSLSNDSYVKYVGNSTHFTVMWENVSLQEKPISGNFTFQATLCKNGDIIFVYKNIPNITNEITEDYHPVKIGLSDAYILDRTIYFVRRKTIFEYHRVQVDKTVLKNWTVIYFKALPTCLNKKTCESCLAKDISFDCQWCDGRCSTGFDRKRYDWMTKDCDKRKINETKYCHLANEKIPMTGAHKADFNQNDVPQNSKTSSGAVFFIILSIACLFSALVWTLYAYRNPHSTSGQILIRYRPNQWSSWRKGEARYTAATIHM